MAQHANYIGPKVFPAVVSISGWTSTHSNSSYVRTNMGRVPGSTFRWTKEATEALLHSLVTSINAGLRADLGYSHRAWVYAVQAASTAQGGEITMRQAKTKHDGLKADYRIWIPLVRQLWFTRDADGDVVAPEAEWNAYIMVGNQSPSRQLPINLILIGTLH